ncbi:unnamed protein product [Heligmosomoides polygyrus]|uniref:ATPase inhibitor, mitochondrial n=1 Tax=Heligmosomoides polygyrus TaxID=6339 RepID=A0A183FJ65_HELPZ|nr:unnamed protein product [Heligmosomoides polygyrus]
MALRLCILTRGTTRVLARGLADRHGRGVGKGGGAGGAIREAGGAFGERQAAKEEDYFRKKTRDAVEAYRRQAGRAVGKPLKEKAAEAESFCEKMKRQYDELKAQIQKEIKHYEAELEDHKAILEMHRRHVKEINDEVNKCK